METETSAAVPQGGPTDPAKQPLWRRIVDFPLVTMVIMFVAIAVPMGVIDALTRKIPEKAMPNIVYHPLKFLLMAAVLLTIYKFLTRRLGEIRRDDVPLDARAIDGLRGAALAFAMMTLIVAVAWILGSYRVIGWGGMTTFTRALFIMGLVAALTEELLFRAIVFRFLEEFGGSWFALALSAGLFGAMHFGNPNATVFTSVAIAIEAGILLGGAYMLTGNLWLAMGLHAGWNFTQGFIWDVPVSGFEIDGMVEAQPAGNPLLSGGAFGLEASLIGLVTATAVGIAFVVQAARRGHIMQPWWVRRRIARERIAAI